MVEATGVSMSNKGSFLRSLWRWLGREERRAIVDMMPLGAKVYQEVYQDVAGDILNRIVMADESRGMMIEGDGCAVVLGVWVPEMREGICRLLTPVLEQGVAKSWGSIAWGFEFGVVLPDAAL